MSLNVQGNTYFKFRNWIKVTLGLACCSYALAKDECTSLLDISAPAAYRVAEYFNHTFYYLKFQNHVNQLRHMFDRWMKTKDVAVFPNEQEFYARAFGIYSELLDVSVLLYAHKKFPLGSLVTLEDGIDSLRFPKVNLSKLSKGFVEAFKVFRDEHVNTEFKDQGDLYQAMRNSGKLELHLMGALLFSPEKILIYEDKAALNP